MTLLGLVLAAALAGQTHPCDEVWPTHPTLQSPVLAGFCYSVADPINLEVLIDENVIWTGTVAPLGGPNAAGLSYFETPRFDIAPGEYAADLAYGTLLSNEVTFSIVELTPPPDPEPDPPEEPEPPAPDPCAVDPLVLSVNHNGWPGSDTGAQIRYRVSRPATILFNPFVSPWTLTAVDDRGCVATVAR